MLCGSGLWRLFQGIQVIKEAFSAQGLLPVLFSGSGLYVYIQARAPESYSLCVTHLCLQPGHLWEAYHTTGLWRRASREASALVRQEGLETEARVSEPKANQRGSGMSHLLTSATPSSWPKSVSKCSVVVILDRVSLCGPGCPRAPYVDQAGLKLRAPPASAS